MTTQQLDDRTQRGLQRVLATLTKTLERTDNHYSRLRAFDRQTATLAIWVCQPTLDEPVLSENHSTARKCWSYSLSRSGIGFVSQSPLEANSVGIGLILPTGINWKIASVVRRREIPGEEFWEFGAAFQKM
jgi:hypothetical protein